MNQPAQPDKSLRVDDELVRLLREDHGSALKEIFNKYHIHLFGIAMGVLRDEDTAKDIIQEVFIDLWNRRHGSDIQTLSHYLARAVKFQVLKHIRDCKNRDRHIQIMEDIQFVNQTEELINVEALESSLRHAVDQLPPRCKEVFVLSRYENLSHKEISQRLNISPKTIEIQITKALSLVRVFVDKAMILTALTFLF
jgi:RNA polymerase sigma-70 factor (family 1)